MWTVPAATIFHDFRSVFSKFFDLWTLLEQNAVCGQSPKGQFFYNIPLPVRDSLKIDQCWLRFQGPAVITYRDGVDVTVDRVL